MEKIKCKAIIVAGGKGLRMGSKTKKQFMEVNGEPIIVSTIKAVLKSRLVDGVVVVAPKDDIEFVKNLINDFKLSGVENVVLGGSVRSESVKQGLDALGECDIVAIHDGVRPMVSEECIDNCIKDACKYGASTLGVKPKDTIKESENKEITRTLDREKLVLIQTPQCFRYEIIRKAYEDFDKDFTDDCAQVEKYGYKVHITEGDYKNIKITTPEDINIMEMYMNIQKK